MSGANQPSGSSENHASDHEDLPMLPVDSHESLREGLLHPLADGPVKEDYESDQLTIIDDHEPEGTANKRCCWGRLSRLQCGLLAGGSFVVLGFTFAVLMVYVFGPMIAQHELKHLALNVKSFDISQPANASFEADVHVQLDGSDCHPFSGTTSPTTLTMQYKGQDFAQMAIPSAQMSAGETTDLYIHTVANVSDLGVWANFAQQMVQSALISFKMHGRVDVTTSVLGLDVKIKDLDLDKDTSVLGCDHLSNVSMQVFDLTKSTPQNVIVDVSVDVNNPSVVSIEPAGDLEFEMRYKGSYLGILKSTNTSLMSGLSTINMRGIIHPTSKPMLDDLMSRWLQGTPTNVTAVAKSVSNHLFDGAIKDLVLTTLLKSIATQIVQSLELNALSVHPVDDQTATALTTATVGIQNPLGADSPIDITQVQMQNVSLMSGDGVVVGYLNGPLVPVTSGGKVGKTGSISFQSPCTLTFASNYPRGMVHFVTQFLQQETVQVQMTGFARTVANSSVGVIDVVAPVKDLETTLAGMNNLTDVNISSWRLTGTSIETSLFTEAVVGNPSVVGVQIGDLDLAASALSGQLHLGTLRADNVTLAAKQDTVLGCGGHVHVPSSELGEAGEFFSTFLQGKAQRVTVTGESASIGGKSVAWLDQAVEVMTMTPQFPGFNDTASLIQDLQIGALAMQLTGPSGASAEMAGSASLNIKLPPQMEGFPFQVTGAAMKFSMISMDTQAVIATMDLPATSTTTQYDPKTAHLSLSFSYTPLGVGSTKAFSDFVGTALRDEHVTVRMVGTGEIKASTQLGSITLSGIPFDQNVTVDGMAGLKDVVIRSIDLFGGSPTSINMTTHFDVTSKSSVAVSLGRVSLNLYADTSPLAEALAVVTVEDFTLKAKDVTSFVASAVYTTPKDAAAGAAFLSRYVSRQAQPILMMGDASSSSSPLIGPALDGYQMHSTMPGRDKQLLVAGQMDVPPLYNVPKMFDDFKSLPTIMLVNNPFSAPFRITMADATIYWIDGSPDPLPMGLFTKDDLVQNPMSVTPNAENVNVDCHCTCMATCFGNVSTAGFKWAEHLFEAFSKVESDGSVQVKVSSIMSVEIGIAGADPFASPFKVTLGVAETSFPVNKNFTSASGTVRPCPNNCE